MSTIRERAKAPMRVPADLPFVAGALQEAMFDRRALLTAGDALAEEISKRFADLAWHQQPCICWEHRVVAAWKVATG